MTHHSRPPRKRDDASVASALEAMGSALSSGDAAHVAVYWDLPGVVLADEGARGLETHQVVAEFFQAAIRWYRDQGTPIARPVLRHVEWISDRLSAVSVDWLGLDAHHVERSRESSFYIMRVGDDGVPRIHVAMSRLAPEDL